MEIESLVGAIEKHQKVNGGEVLDHTAVDDGNNNEMKVGKSDIEEGNVAAENEKLEKFAKKEKEDPDMKKRRVSRSESRSPTKRRRHRRRRSSTSGTHSASSKSPSRSQTKSHSRSRSPKRANSRSRSRSRHKSSKKKARRISHSYTRSRSPVRRRKASRSQSPRHRVSRSSSSSSRDTYGSFKAMSLSIYYYYYHYYDCSSSHPSQRAYDDGSGYKHIGAIIILIIVLIMIEIMRSPARPVYDYPCRKCGRDFETIRELCEHEIRAHGACFPCPHCEKQASSVQKLCEHMKRRHSDYRLLCDFCKDDFGGKVSSAKDSNWEDFRDHIYKECLKEKIYLADRQRGRSAGIAQRGRGRCPHGPPVKCKNFPNCPGEKCYYFHGYCRYDKLCVKKECPFDHTDRPRICLSCLRDYKA
ncbi:unnamed protein product [Thelazia callipaeda]|uniref:C2H2-type domain-containing protein n=1 Tax=Thelazia callipaeda TaxID=103827 RepID=A0A0N5CXY8_THECL|nr:unnamed protein product [Thelazia callipaeda]